MSWGMELSALITQLQVTKRDLSLAAQRRGTSPPESASCGVALQLRSWAPDTGSSSAHPLAVSSGPGQALAERRDVSQPQQ